MPPSALMDDESRERPGDDQADEADMQPVIDELQATCNSLGKVDENDGTYMKDRDCKACLKEIIRFLNVDTKRHAIRIALGQLNLIKSDLIPLINQYCDFNEGDSDLFNLIIRLATNLTSAILLLFENQEIPTDPDNIKVYNQLIKSLYSYKVAFADNEKIWETLNTHLRHTEDEIPFERIVILIRNILHIPVDSTADQGMHSDFDTHSLCLYRMQQSGMFHTIIEIASETQRGTDFCFHIIEIVHLMLRDQNPVTVATAQANRNKRKLDDDDEDRKRLAELSARNRRDREIERAKYAPPRFKNSLFVVKNCLSLSDDNHLLSRQLISKRESISFDAGKTQLRKSKNKKPLSSEKSSVVLSDRNTKPSQVTYSLKVFSKLFVEKVYANYMQQIKHNLIQKKAAENDESYYLWSVQYFTAFCRQMQMSLDFISETMSTSTLHFIQILISGYQDKIKIEKKRSQVEVISKRLHLAVRAYREILYLIQSIKEGSEFWNTIETIKKNILTELEYNTLILTLFQQYDESKHCPEYLKDLIKTNDIFLTLLEDYCKTHNPVEVLTDDVEEGDEEERILDGDDEAGAALLKKKKKKANKKAAKKRRKDQEFRTLHFMARYCIPEVIKAYSNVLQDFKTNDTELNLQILKFLERVAYDCKYDVMLLQASFLNLLLSIVEYHSSMPGYDGFLALTTHLMSTFGDMIGKKRWMIEELLFWKTQQDVIEIESAVDPPPPPPVAASPVHDDLGLSTETGAQVALESQEGEAPSNPIVDSLEELMAELDSSGSDSSVDDGLDDLSSPPSPAPSTSEPPPLTSPVPSPAISPAPSPEPQTLTSLLASSPESSLSSPALMASSKRRSAAVLDSSSESSASPSPLPSPVTTPSESSHELNDIPAGGQSEE